MDVALLRAFRILLSSAGVFGGGVGFSGIFVGVIAGPAVGRAADRAIGVYTPYHGGNTTGSIGYTPRSGGNTQKRSRIDATGWREYSYNRSIGAMKWR